MTAALANAAREVHDNEEFIEHIGNIADRFRREHALETGPRGRDVRRTLKVFRKHAQGVSAWLAVAHAKPGSLEYDALAKVGAAMHSAPNQTLASSAAALTWLQQAAEAASAAEAVLSSKKQMTALRIAADALRGTFAHHGLKWSTQVSKKGTGSAVRILCALAKSAGDELVPQHAREVLMDASR